MLCSTIDGEGDCVGFKRDIKNEMHLGATFSDLQPMLPIAWIAFREKSWSISFEYLLKV